MGRHTLGTQCKWWISQTLTYSQMKCLDFLSLDIGLQHQVFQTPLYSLRTPGFPPWLLSEQRVLFLFWRTTPGYLRDSWEQKFWAIWLHLIGVCVRGCSWRTTEWVGKARQGNGVALLCMYGDKENLKMWGGENPGRVFNGLWVHRVSMFSGRLRMRILIRLSVQAWARKAGKAPISQAPWLPTV